MILVTGGAGRLGQSVVRRLAEVGHAVVSVDTVQVQGLPADQLRVDLRDQDATSAMMVTLAPEIVIHLAAIAIPFSAPEAVIFKTNTVMAWNVLDAATTSGVSCVLTASSPTVLGYGAPAGWSPDYLPLDERHSVAPWNAYALSKQVIENMVAMFSQKNPTTKYGAFRPCFVISPNEWHGAPTQLGHTVVDRLNSPALSAVSIFNYVDARDAADFVLAWVEKAPELDNGSVFFVGADDALAQVSLSELIPSYVPEWARLASRLAGSSPAFTSAKARETVGWRPTRSWRTELSEDQWRLLVPIQGATNIDHGDYPPRQQFLGEGSNGNRII